MVDVLAAPQQAKTDASLRTLAAISTAHWVSHFHLFVLPMLFPFLKEQLGVGYIELGFALTVFAVVSGLTQAPIGYLADHIGARKVLLIGLTLGGSALIMLGLHLSYPWLIASAVLLGLANSVYHPADYAILSAHMDEARMGRAFSIHTFAGFLGGAVAPAIVAALVAVIGGYGALISTANLALTAFLGASAIGVLAGGLLADRTRRHGQVAAACFAVNAAIMFIIATIALPSLLLMAAMTTAGFLGGVIAPSRDMLVRDAAPPGAAGRAFGIVTTGFTLGGIVSPLLFGWIMDRNWPQWVFGASVVFMILTVLLALVTDRRPQASSESPDARP